MMQKRRRHPGRNAALLILTLLVVGTFALRNVVFVVDTILVEGNNYRTAAEVIAQSGLRTGQSMLAVNADAVKQAIEGDRYLRYQSLYRSYPSTVLIRVSEVMPVATLTWLGMLYSFDVDGIALDQTTQLDLALAVPVVTGAQIETIQLGIKIKTRNNLQMETLLEVLAELTQQGGTGEIAELNVSDLDNMYFITQDGLQVELGDRDALGDKIRLMRAVLPEIRRLGPPSGGVLNVTSGLSADYQLPQSLWTPAPTASPSPIPS